jgi:3-dehydroquinate dehydratase-2
MTKMKIMILHGPNLNLLGSRETEIYGSKTLNDINEDLRKQAKGLGVEIQEILQTNSESDLVERIQAAQSVVDGMVINPAAYTHTSIALRDVLLATAIPFVEVHLSNVYAREPFRQRSYLSDIAVGVVAGFGPESYSLALEGLVRSLQTEKG